MVLLATVCYAQGIISPRGRFSVAYTRGCNPFTVTVTDVVNAPQIKYYLRYKSRTDIEELVGNTASITVADTLYLVQVAESLMPPKDSLMLVSYSAAEPEFNVTACSGNAALVEISSRNYDFYEVQFNNQSPVRADQSTNFRASGQFGSEGTHSIAVRGRYNNDAGNCAPATTSVKTWTVLPAPQLLGLQFKQQADSVYIQYQLEPGILYQLERRASPADPYLPLFQFKAPAAESSLSQADMSSTAYCYRIRAIDACTSTNAPAVSEELCTASWSVASQNGQNQVRYATHSGFSGTVELQHTDGEQVAVSSLTAGELTEADVICKETYCYQLVLRPASGSGAYAISSPVCVEAQSTQPLRPLKNIVSRWATDRQLVIHPLLATAAEHVSFTLMNAEGNRLTAATADSLVLGTIPAGQCYQLNYADRCGNRATTPTPFCPLYLENISTEPDVLVLQWNAYEGYAEGVAYYVLEEVNSSGAVINSWNTGTETEYDNFPPMGGEDSGRRFRVLAYPKEVGIDHSISNIYTYELVMQGYFPNAFSPNDDGLNDTFNILGKFVQRASIWVYNRWGELLFYSDDKEKGWDGTYSGKAVPEGPYTYKSLVITEDGKEKQLTGTVFLTR
ncbi:hypothetical protein D770_03705 [Flammeovirgaceae bacterium 311]|nr:hypothetical protein D770_03705 [Flammeovirgaceae bacterium 311]